MKYPIVFFFFLILHNLLAQQIPHTLTLPGLLNTPFTYTQPSDVGIPNEKFEQLRREIKSWVSSGDVVGNEVLIIKNNSIIFHETYGWADLETNKPVARNSIWNIRSMTKPITATAIMILVEEGRITLEDKVINYIPEFKGNANTTIGHLISHTSGYSRRDFKDYDEYENVETLEDWVKAGATTIPTGNYGVYEYTDFGFVASAYIIEKITGIALKDFIDQEILVPLGLQNTRVNFSDDPEWRSRLSTWYEIDQETGKYIVDWPISREGWEIFGGAWGMFSTVLDYAEFLSCFKNHGKWNHHQLLDKESTELMLSPQGYSNDIPMYGYGWMLQVGKGDEKNLMNFGHRGGIIENAGYFFPQEDLIMVYMSHSRGGLHRDALMEVLNDLELIRFTNYRGYPIRPDTYHGKIVKLSEEEKSKFLGHYKDIKNNGELSDITMKRDNLALYLYSEGQQTKEIVDLLYLGNNRFTIGDYIDGELDWLNPEAIIEFHEAGDSVISIEFKYRDRIVLQAMKEQQ